METPHIAPKEEPEPHRRFGWRDAATATAALTIVGGAFLLQNWKNLVLPPWAPWALLGVLLFLGYASSRVWLVVAVVFLTLAITSRIEYAQYSGDITCVGRLVCGDYLGISGVYIWSPAANLGATVLGGFIRKSLHHRAPA